MLVLTRAVEEKICVGDDVVVQVLRVRSDGRVSLGITAPPHMEVDRAEIRRDKQRRRRAAASPEGNG